MSMIPQYCQDDNSEFTIYIFNAKDNVIYPVIKNCFDLSDAEVYKTISEEFKILKHRLKIKDIDYDKLKGALLPNQEKEKFETCFIFDSCQISDSNYGYTIFSKLLPLLDRDSTYSVLCGDYIDILNNVPDAQFRLKSAMNDVIVRCNKSSYRHSNQYFLIYINRLTALQRLTIVEGLMKYPWFTGFTDVTRHSLFKTYSAYILTHSFIKCRGKIISSHPSDYSDDENINMLGYPFEENGYQYISINEDSYFPFLSYKIEAIVPDETDVSFSFNALFPKFDSVNKLHLKIDDKKWNEYLLKQEGNGKGKIIESLGYNICDKEKFRRDIFKRICSSYIYKLERKCRDGKWIWQFCVCIDMPTINDSFRKTTIVLNYFPDTGEMAVITLT